MGVSSGDAYHNLAGFTHGQVLEVRANCKVKISAADAGTAFGRCTVDGVGQGGAIIITVHVSAQGGQINRN